MVNKFLIFRDEVEEQLAAIRQLEDTLQEIDKNKELDNEIAKRVYGSILEDFYMAVEKIFKSIASEIDDDLPEDAKWHKKLLRQMSVEIPGTRPPVLNKDLFHNLEEYLRFRHLIHNIYGFQLDYERFEHLIQKLPKTIDKFETQIMRSLNEIEEIIGQ
ncbi:MAG: hypothetical protein ACOCQC_03120 [Halanaerobiaceae bacterium]